MKTPDITIGFHLFTLAMALFGIAIIYGSTAFTLWAFSPAVWPAYIRGTVMVSSITWCVGVTWCWLRVQAMLADNAD